MCAGPGVWVSGCGQVWEAMGKGRQVWMGQTDWVGMGDMGSGWVRVGLQV